MEWMKASCVEAEGFYWIRGVTKNMRTYVSFIQKLDDEMYAYHDCLDYGDFLSNRIYEDAEFFKIEPPE